MRIHEANCVGDSLRLLLKLQNTKASSGRPQLARLGAGPTARRRSWICTQSGK
jgi:hypothetical protein